MYEGRAKCPKLSLKTVMVDGRFLQKAPDNQLILLSGNRIKKSKRFWDFYYLYFNRFGELIQFKFATYRKQLYIRE